MRIFHSVILAYSFACIGCGFKTTPVWRDTPQYQEEKKSQQSIQEDILRSNQEQ